MIKSHIRNYNLIWLHATFNNVNEVMAADKQVSNNLLELSSSEMDNDNVYKTIVF